MVTTEFVDHSGINNFFSQHFFRISYILSGKLNFWLLETFSTTKTENYVSDQKMVKSKFFYFLYMNNFFPTFCLYLVYFDGKIVFLISRKTFFMDKIRTIGQKWLVKKLVLSFWALKKCTKARSNPNRKLSCLQATTTADRQAPS